MSKDQLLINTIRFLSVDQVERAKSGHPGMPLGASHIAYLIFDRFLRFNPKNPKWINRDRFVLSAGHASAMLYSLLFVMGYDLSLKVHHARWHHPALENHSPDGSLWI